MADISWARRMDATTGGAMVLTVDAVVFLMTALVGLPFVLFFAADGDDPVGPIWPMATVWAVSALLGSASAAAAFLIGARGTQRLRQAGAATALATAAVTAVLVATSISGSPILAAVSAVFAAANLGAARLLFRPESADAETPALPEAFLLAAPLAEAEVRTRPTIEIELGRPTEAPKSDPADAPEAEPSDDLDTAAADELATEPGDESIIESATQQADKTGDEPLDAPADPTHDATGTEAGTSLAESPVTARPRRPRGPAAMHTLTGVRLPRRAYRPRADRN
ncbi:hypothetical protein [Actinoplanes sp. HUAS TT8]|uniref:hypothetical protein n=1 Tax=Actinoplanes sp. HUAS TT8 TaxID=3447453 RepID=UPI003F51CBEF